MRRFLRDGIAVAGVVALLGAAFHSAPANAQATDYTAPPRWPFDHEHWMGVSQGLAAVTIVRV
ncbi:MAG TPA: hypothetical protein VKC66_38430 [Xanthobacteraceae bacterium]|nr:hypothetical protein [Xanthobacteraceae bacterium]